MEKRQHGYRVESVGRDAVFYLPSDLMGMEIESGIRCRQMVEDFLEQEYGGFTDEGNNHNGFWKNAQGTRFYERYQKYRVAFTGPERIPKLESFLSYIAKGLNEESIFISTGEDSWLLYPEE